VPPADLDRDARRAAALRANLRRRKAQGRERARARAEGQPPAAEDGRDSAGPAMPATPEASPPGEAPKPGNKS
jgi:hypothetical protein